jgi:hypothetical protein
LLDDRILEDQIDRRKAVIWGQWDWVIPAESSGIAVALLSSNQGVRRMAKRQTRRSISIRGTTYRRLREHCATTEISMSDFLEQRIAEFFGEEVEATAAKPAARLQAIAAKMNAARQAAGRPVPTLVKAPAPVTRLPQKPLQSAPRPVAKPALRQAPKPVVAPPLRKAAPLPVQSTINRKPAAAALRSTMNEGKPQSGNVGNVGRPAPTPASQVLKTRSTPSDGKDYRGIRF